MNDIRSEITHFVAVWQDISGCKLAEDSPIKVRTCLDRATPPADTLKFHRYT